MQVVILILTKGGYKLRREVSKIIWKQMLAIFLCYFVTLSIYPGVLSDLVSPRFGTWMPVLVMTVFNLFDLMGKVSGTHNNFIHQLQHYKSYHSK